MKYQGKNSYVGLNYTLSMLFSRGGTLSPGDVVVFDDDSYIIIGHTDQFAQPINPDREFLLNNKYSHKILRYIAHYEFEE